MAPSVAPSVGRPSPTSMSAWARLLQRRVVVVGGGVVVVAAQRRTLLGPSRLARAPPAGLAACSAQPVHCSSLGIAHRLTTRSADRGRWQGIGTRTHRPGRSPHRCSSPWRHSPLQASGRTLHRATRQHTCSSPPHTRRAGYMLDRTMTHCKRRLAIPLGKRMPPCRPRRSRLPCRPTCRPCHSEPR